MERYIALRQRQASEMARLPVPPLQQTVDRYLRSVQVFLTDDEFRVTEQLARGFTEPGGVGEKLQKLLEDRAANTDNWLAEWWLSKAYLENRSPLPVFSNTCQLLPLRPPFASLSEQLAHAATVVTATLNFRDSLGTDDFPTERMGPYPLDMSQYFMVFGSNRTPGVTKDTLQLIDVDDPCQFIVVAHNNHFFSVPVYDEAGRPLNQAQLQAQLHLVVEQSPVPAPDPVGLLTSADRATWGRAYLTLREDAVNRESLDAIQRALFLVCLDEEDQADVDDPVVPASFKMMHGAGCCSANRWFDKTIQLIVGANGEAGLNYEHSPAEGQPVALILDNIHSYFLKHGSTDPLPPASKFEAPKRLPFVVSAEVQDAILVAQRNLDSLIQEIDIAHFHYQGYGKEFIKSHNLSPDSYVQMAIQLAFYRLHKVPGAQYESASTRRFLHGRTETIRSCSLESVLFARTMLDPAASDVDKAGALRAAVQGHRDYAIKAVSGQGVDRHLLGLRLAAAEVGMEVPQLFLDTGYTRSGHMRLSTSQVAVRCPEMRGFFSPLVEDGYSVVYNPLPNTIMVCTTAFAKGPDTSATELIRALTRSFDDIRDVLSSAANASSL